MKTIFIIFIVITLLFLILRRSVRKLLIALHDDLTRIMTIIDRYLALQQKNNAIYNTNMNNIIHYTLILEDKRFYTHSGVDWVATMREILKCIRHHFYKMLKAINIPTKRATRCGGASTIDMQLVRTITNYRKHSLKRKMYEMLLALIINRKLKTLNFTNPNHKKLYKKSIIHTYLSIGFYGSGLIGVQKASLITLGRDIYHEILTNKDCAILAAMLLRPKPMRANLNDGSNWSHNLLKRASYADKINGILTKDQSD